MTVEQKKYDSIIRHGKTGTHETVKDGDYVVIWEKLDGANASFMLNEDGTEILCFSRNNLLDASKENNLRGFYQWVQNNINIDCLYSNYIYYGEWLVPHKINYGDNANDFYLFDIYHKENKEYLNEEEVVKESNLLNIKTAPVLKNGIIGKGFTLQEIFDMAGISKLAPDGKGEGIVIKNYSHKHKDGKQVFTKVVTKDFQENNGAKIKIAKVSDPLGEFVDKTVTEARVEKMLLKLVDEGKIPEDYDLEHMGLILKSLGSSVADDIIKEELDELLKIVKGKIGRKVPNIVKEIITKNV